MGNQWALYQIYLIKSVVITSLKVKSLSLKKMGFNIFYHQHKLMKSIIIVLVIICSFLSETYGQIMGDKTNTRVLVVGISNYQDEKITDLKFAHKDAEAFEKYMRSEAGGGLESAYIRILKNEEATTAQIYSGLDWLLEESEKNDKVIIYFSGHGDVETKTISQRGYLLAYDTPSNNYRVGSVRLDDLKDILATLSQVNEAQIVLITDACHSGNLAGNNIGGTQATAVALTTQFANEVKIMSCQPNEFSLEGVQWGGGRGIFSYHLIEGMIGLADRNEDGLINLREIERYLEDKVSEEAAPHSQMPMTVGDKNTRIAFINEQKLDSLKEEKSRQEDLIDVIVSKNKNIENLIQGDTNIVEMYADFTKALESKYFLSSDIDATKKAGESASELYEILSKEEVLRPVHNIMKRDFAAALQDQAQQDVIAYLNTDSEEMNERWKNYGANYVSNPEYLAKAAELLGEQHYMYKQLLAKRLYFEGLITRLNAEQSSDETLYAQALEKIKTALEYDDQAAYVYNEMGLIKQGQRDFKTAQLYFDTAMMIAPTWVLPPNNLCRIYKILHQYDKAEHFGKKAIALKPDYFQAYYNLGEVFFAEKEFAKAKKMYEKAIEFNPNYAKALINLGKLYLDENKKDIALQLFEQAVQSDSNYYFGRYNLGLAYFKKEDYKNAVTHFQKAFELRPKNKQLCDDLGYAYFKTEQYEKAETYFLKALEIDPTYEQAHRYLNKLYYNTKQWEAAEKNLLKWIQINPKKAVSYYDLACIKSFQNQIPEGLEYLEQSFKKGYQNLDIIKTDSDIENLRKTDAYQELLKKYFPED